MKRITVRIHCTLVQMSAVLKKNPGLSIITVLV